MILLGLIVRSYLSAEERDLVHCDPVTAAISSGCGFTAVETRLMQRLQQETLDAIQSLNMAERPVGTEPASAMTR